MSHTTTKPPGAIDREDIPPAKDSVPEDHAARPTAKQLAYLRELADRAGQTFSYPHTVRQASAEIRRLRAQKPSGRVERVLERREIADAIARGPEDSAAVLPSEVDGFGSTATWR